MHGVGLSDDIHATNHNKTICRYMRPAGGLLQSPIHIWMVDLSSQSNSMVNPLSRFTTRLAYGARHLPRGHPHAGPARMWSPLETMLLSSVVKIVLLHIRMPCR